MGKNNPILNRLTDDQRCFACGDKNSMGLRILWTTSGKTTRATFTPQKHHQGWKGIVHGGILATLLDEAMTRLAWKVCGGAVTAEMTVRYLKAAPIGKPLHIFGEIVQKKGRLVKAQAHIKNDEGKVLAKAQGKALLTEKGPRT